MRVKAEVEVFLQIQGLRLGRMVMEEALCGFYLVLGPCTPLRNQGYIVHHADPSLLGAPGLRSAPPRFAPPRSARLCLGPFGGGGGGGVVSFPKPYKEREEARGHHQKVVTRRCHLLTKKKRQLCVVPWAECLQEPGARNGFIFHFFSVRETVPHEGHTAIGLRAL